ncbi:MAG: M48 family metallopeptidase [Burkholderiaceae bacterium]|nr:M48 family metallopeptidase [Burkholderiaceae bacterium]
MNLKPLICILLTTALVLNPTVSTLAQTYNLPDLGVAGGATISPLQERQLGEQIMLQVRDDPTYLSDPETAEYLNRIGYRLVSHSPSNGYSFNFFAIKDPSLNAFALPGGFIAVHTGLVIAASTESELASVMAHEISHVEQRHIARMIENQKGSLAMTLGSLIVAILAARSGSGDGAAAALVGTQAAMAQNYLSFSRDAEREADRLGYSTLVQSGFDPRGMQSFFEKLDFNSRSYEGANAAPAYLRTHPLTIERISEAQNRARLSKPVNHEDSLDFYLIQARLRVLQSNRYQSWSDASAYFKNDLKTAKGYRAIADHYGLALASLKMKNNALATQEIELARKSIKKSAILEKFYSEVIFSTNRTRGLELAKQAYNHHPLSQMTVINYVTLLQRAGKHSLVVDTLRKQNAISKQSVFYQQTLGRAYEAMGKKSLSHQAIGESYALMGQKVAAVRQFSIAQQANDADFYTMSEIDARLRQLRQELAEDKMFE